MKAFYNPFIEASGDEIAETELIARSLQGDRRSLEALVLRHQSWIYNIALRMVYDPAAAEDVTQEVLIKVITKLGTFDPSKAAFRTWLYRLVVNHIINAKRSRNEAAMEEALRGEGYDRFVEGLPDRRLTAQPGAELYQEEVKMACVQCLLFSLSRRERIIFILGVVFGVPDTVGSEMCDVSRANFRKILSRSRSRIHTFFQDRCSLLDEKNPCRCAYFLSPLVRSGMIDTEDLLIRRDSHGTIAQAVTGAVRQIEASYEEFVSLFRSQPFLKSPDMIRWLRDLLDREDIKPLFQIA